MEAAMVQGHQVAEATVAVSMALEVMAAAAMAWDTMAEVSCGR